MLNPSEILETAVRKWPSVLRAEATGENLFPLQIPFGRPKTTDDFAIIKREIEALAAARLPWRIDWAEIRTRKWGQQRWPIRVVFDSADKLAAALNRSEQLQRVRTAIRSAREVCPALEPWLRLRADHIVDHLDDWCGLISVCQFFNENPQPRCFSRQVPLPVGTKFIEEHAGILGDLLDVVLGDRVNQAGATFSERFHLLAEPPQIRFRFLDGDLQHRVHWPVTDCSVSQPTFAGFTWTVERVVIVENRDVFLCLPQVPDTLAIFGSGKAASLLPTCEWLNTADIIYWGDCDEAGYGILSNLRSRFSHVCSLLMDDVAWSRWKHLAVAGKRDPTARHSHLTPPERAALDAVLAGPWMLEQERIPPREAATALFAALAATTPRVSPLM